MLHNKSKFFYMNIYIVHTKNLNPDVTRQNNYYQACSYLSNLLASYCLE